MTFDGVKVSGRMKEGSRVNEERKVNGVKEGK